MKKFLVVVMAVIMTLSLAACGGGGEEEAAGDAAAKVGCIFIGSVNDGGFTQVMNEGLEAAAEETGVELIKKENVSDTDAQATLDAATNLIDQGCTIIVGCSYGFGQTLNDLAAMEEYADITFLHFSGSYQNESNLENFFGSMEEARYLAGMAAAAASKDGVLGYVAPFDNLAEPLIGINAYTLGAQAVNPDVEVKVVSINTWMDAELEKAAAEQLIAEGCDVLTYHADSTATQLAAQEAGIYTTGWNLKNNVAGDYYLTAPYWDMSAYFTPTIQAILDGTFAPTGEVPFSNYGSMASGMICIDEFGPGVPADAVEKINAVKEQMVNGEFKVFSGEIKYADGEVLCKEGQTLTNEEIWSLNTKVVEDVTSSSSN